MGRTARTTAASTGAAVVLLLGGCGAGTDAPRAEPSTRDVVISQVGPPDAPDVVTDVPAERAWTLARLEPPPGLQVVSSVQRPDSTNVSSYLVVATATPEDATAVCEQMGGLLGLRETPLSEQQRAPFDLAEDPEGELGLCSGATNGERLVVQRDVLVAESGGTVTVWLSTFEMVR